MNPIDAQLYRPLKAGKEYEKLIPPYKGIDFGFDKKKDNSNTYDTLRFMGQWSQKYAEQMSKIAPMLKGKTVQATVNNIYHFLYNHFQYKIDGELQNLYSPSAAWHFREKGFDCKTYSILASTILQNLNLPHAFRMVKQAGINPNLWSHVYVVVPNGENYYVIDATTHNNKEVSFINKYDHNMNHRGLASPFVKFSGLGCACQGEPIAHTGLGSPDVLARTVGNFHNFLNVLEKQGISREVTNKMLELVKFNIQNGIDPNMGEVLQKALNTQQGLGASQAVTGLVNSGMTAANNISIGGVNLASTAAQLMEGNFVGAGIGVLKNVLPIEKTFGAVFANGFDLSCWGASYSEQKAKLHVEKDMPYILEWSRIYTSPTTENLDRFMYLTQAYGNDSRNGQNKKYAACTRKGHALREKIVDELRKNVFEEFKSQNFQLVPAGKKKGANLPVTLPGYGAGSVFGWANKDVEWDSYNVIAPKPVAQQSQAPAVNTSIDATGTKTTTITNADGSQTITKTDVNGNTTNTTVAAPSKSSMGTILTVGSIIALGVKFLL